MKGQRRLGNPVAACTNNPGQVSQTVSAASPTRYTKICTFTGSKSTATASALGKPSVTTEVGPQSCPSLCSSLWCTCPPAAALGSFSSQTLLFELNCDPCESSCLCRHTHTKRIAAHWVVAAAACCCYHYALQLLRAVVHMALQRARSHHIVFARALCALIPSHRLFSHVSNDGLAFIFGCAHFGGSLYQEEQLAVVIGNLLALVIEAAADCDGCASQLVDLGYGFPMRNLQSPTKQK